MSRHSYLNTYTPSFARHLHNVAVSGFFARDLDADDHEFLERVKCRGIANGTLENTSAVLLEELEFWHLPYAIDWTIKRTHGPVPTRGQPETPESIKVRRAAWHARNAERLANNAIANAEMERERAEYEAAQARRKHREIFGQAEWDAADPKRKVDIPKNKKRKLAPFAGARGNPHYYVPQWEIEKKQAEQAKRDARKAEKEAEAASERAERAKTARAEAEKNLEAIKAGKLIANAKREYEEWCASVFDPTEVEATKKAIAAIIRASYPAVWLPEQLTRSLGFGLEKLQFVTFCAEEMVKAGQIITAKTRVPA